MVSFQEFANKSEDIRVHSQITRHVSSNELLLEKNANRPIPVPVYFISQESELE